MPSPSPSAFAVVAVRAVRSDDDVGVDRARVDRRPLAHLDAALARRVEQVRVERAAAASSGSPARGRGARRRRVAETQLDEVDLLLDDRGRVDGHCLTAPRRQAAAAGLVPGEAALSTSSTDAPASARRSAVVDPAGRPATTSAS
jgi:hypothetical protein